MILQKYVIEFKRKAREENKNEEYIQRCIDYASTLYEKKIPIIYNQDHFSKLVGMDMDFLLRIANSQKHFYRYFKIPKRNGRLRKIAEPLPMLKEVQRFILTNILENIKCSDYSKAFKKGVSIKENAKFHRRQKYILKIDLKDYFDNLNEERVSAFFRGLGYKEDVCVLLTKMCVLNHSLPQGALTSPYLSNLLTINLDEELFAFCNDKKLRYTRYADDITISGENHLKIVLSDVFRIIKANNLKINYNKISIISNNKQQNVTGIVVNKKLQASKEYRKKIRQEVYYIMKYGLNEHIKMTNVHCDPRIYLFKILGKVSYCLQVNKSDDKMKLYKKQILQWISETE